MKVTIIGAGNVGATCANVLAQKDILKEIVLLDVKENVAEGKSLDIWQSAPVNSFNTRVVGVTNEYERTKHSQVVVITSGIPRSPGMSRDDLIGTNARIVKEVTQKAIKYSPNAIFIVVSNPLDVMTYVAYLSAAVDSSRVFGMAGVLDTARYRAFLAKELACSPLDIQALLLGGHGDTMIPLPRYTTVSGIPIGELLDRKKIEKIIERTKKGGGEILELLGASAWYSPGACVAQMIEAIIKDSKRILPCCVWLKGEYNLEGIYLGLPVILGRNGIEKIIELQLDKEELALIKNSAKEVKKTMDVLDKMNLF